jgi:hypothetical protein
MTGSAPQMTPDVAQLARDVAALKDRQAVLDVISRHARGCDRHDVELLISAYWRDGVDEHGATITAGPDYAAWANAVHGASSVAHQHHVTTHSCEIDGDTAHAESYVIVVLLASDERSARVMSGRYLDRLERRDGEWRIAVRRSTVEASFTADASLLQNSFFLAQSYPRGTRERDDLSYARPLTLDTPAAARWS